jgi:hypothetical protein
LFGVFVFVFDTCPNGLVERSVPVRTLFAGPPKPASGHFSGHSVPVYLQGSLPQKWFILTIYVVVSHKHQASKTGSWIVKIFKGIFEKRK